MDDNRVFARIEVKFPLRFLDPSSGKEGKADTTDISANGVGLISDDYLPSMTPLEMWLDIPDKHEPLYVRGEVMWSCPLRDSERQRIGVHLDDARLMDLARVLWFRRGSQGATGG